MSMLSLTIAAVFAWAGLAHSLPSLAIGYFECHPTQPNGHAVSWSTLPRTAYDHGADTLSTNLPPNGTIVFGPGRPGTVLPDGSLRIKFIWFKERSALTMSGRRLDEGGGVLKSEISNAFDAEDFQPSYLVFSAPGCWEITASAGRSTLTFVTEVIRQR